MCDFCAPHSCDMFATASFTKRKCKYKLKYKYKYLVPCHYCDAFVNWIIDINCASISRKGDAIRPDKPETGLKENLLKKWNIWEIFQKQKYLANLSKNWKYFDNFRADIVPTFPLLLTHKSPLSPSTWPKYIQLWSDANYFYQNTSDQNIFNFD